MSGEQAQRREARPRDLATWISGRRSEVERWVEEACQRAIVKTRGVAAEEIRALSRRVERMHDLLDHLERLVESPPAEGASPGAPATTDDAEGKG